MIANEQAALDAAICTLEVVTNMGGNAFVVLLCFFESQRVQSLLGTTVTRHGTIVAELIRGYFNIDAAAIRVPVKTVLISLAGLQLFPLSKRIRHVVIHETAKSLVVICSQLGKVKTRHGAFHKMQPITHSVAHNNLPIPLCRAMT